MIAAYHAAPEPVDVDDIKVTLVREAVYHFKGFLGKPTEDGKERWAFPPADVRLIGAGRHIKCGQELVAYEVLTGKTRGQLFFCTLLQWAEYMEAPKPPEDEPKELAAEPLPRKVAGVKEKSPY